jgi:hypothetical protein
MVKEEVLMKKYLSIILFCFSFLQLSSCANVHQIDRGILAKRIMQLDPHPEETVFQDEVRALREVAIGGGKPVGGGCGCN